MKWRLTLALLLVLGVITGNSNAADVWVESSDGGLCKLAIQGDIDKNTPSQLASRYKSLNKGKPDQCNFITLLLNSNGGDVEAAISAGEFVRQKSMYTMVSVPSSCASACVFVLLGGVTRTPGGNIGLHRPFTGALSTSESMAKGQYERVNRLIRQYLNRMNIPEALLDAMNQIPPGSMQWLRGSSDSGRLQELHLSGEDPVWAEQKNSGSAKNLGVSKKDFYLRQQSVEAICGPAPVSSNQMAAIEKWGKCHDDVMKGKR